MEPELFRPFYKQFGIYGLVLFVYSLWEVFGRQTTGLEVFLAAMAFSIALSVIALWKDTGKKAVAKLTLILNAFLIFIIFYFGSFGSI